MKRGDVDVLVAGGGPAGAAAAFYLARAGVRVRVVERARFPRPKPCAECLSPAASRILNDMGALAELESFGANLRGMIVRAPDGATIRGDYAAAHGFRAFRDRGLAIRRDLLDNMLLSSARAAGAEVSESVRVVDVVRDSSGNVRGAIVLESSGARREERADLVVGADGLRSIVARRLRLARTTRWPSRISLVAHFRGVAGVGEYGEMHVERDGFVGIADVGEGITTVAAVFPLSRAREISGGGDRAGFLTRWLASKPHLEHRFARASRCGQVSAVGPFASHAVRAWAPGAALVGDAADFFDPFTGEGIYAALRGGELVALAALEALTSTSTRRRNDALRAYDEARRREFGGKWKVERLIGAGVAIPAVVNRVAKVMERRKDMADLLIGVTGDFVPAARVLNAAFLARLFLLPVRFAGSAAACP